MIYFIQIILEKEDPCAGFTEFCFLKKIGWKIPRVYGGSNTSAWCAGGG